MPVTCEGVRSKAVGHGWIVRELEVIRGKMYFEVICTPAFNDAQSKHSVEILPHGVKFKNDSMTMMLTTGRKRLWLPHRSSNNINTCGPGAITKVGLRKCDLLFKITSSILVSTVSSIQRNARTERWTFQSHFFL